MRHFELLLLSLAIAITVGGDTVIPPHVPPARLSANSVAMPRIVDRSGARELARLKALPLLAEEQSGMVADGAVRSLERPIAIAVSTLGRITIDGAKATRIRFDDAPPGAVLWLAGSEDEEFVRFEPSATAQWGPTTRGAAVYIMAEGGIGEMKIAELAQIAPIETGQTSCLADVACKSSEDFADLADASRAIGYLRFIRDGKSYVCTGSLLNDSANSRTPYLLTARHCISTPEEAASVEVVWDLKSEACGSNRMAPMSRSHGAELLVESRSTDLALLKLASVPADRVFLGVDTRPLAPGTVVHRISHASGLSQTYSSASVEQGGMTCSVAPRPQFVYTRLRAGATSGGSSGAPLLLPGLYAAGQLRGACGPDPSNACATFNSGVDGALRESWPLLAPYLDPGSRRVRRRAVR